MATFYVDSAATGAANGINWANAFTSINTAVNHTSVTAGDTILVANTHAKIHSGTNITISSKGTISSPLRIISASTVDNSYTPGAIEVVSGGFDLAFIGCAFCLGVTFKRGGTTVSNTDSNNQNINFWGTGNWMWNFEDGGLWLATTSSTARINIGSTSDSQVQDLRLANSWIKFGHTSQTIVLNATLQWVDTPTTPLNGGSIPTTLITPTTSTSASRPARLVLRGLDLSLMTSSQNIVNVSRTQALDILMMGIKTHSSTNLTTGTITAKASVRVTAIDCGSSANPYISCTKGGNGTISTSIAFYRNSGMRIGTTPISLKMQPSSQVNQYNPLRTDWHPFYVTAGNAITITALVCVDRSLLGGVDLTTNDVWLEVSYYNSVSSPLRYLASSRGDPLSAGDSLSGGLGATFEDVGSSMGDKQEYTIQQDVTSTISGLVFYRVCLGNASVTPLYVDTGIYSEGTVVRTSGFLPNFSVVTEGVGADFPDSENVLTTDTTNNIQGEYQEPSRGYYLNTGPAYGPQSAYTGYASSPNTGKVLFGIIYGPQGAPLSGIWDHRSLSEAVVAAGTEFGWNLASSATAYIECLEYTGNVATIFINGSSFTVGEGEVDVPTGGFGNPSQTAQYITSYLVNNLGLTAEQNGVTITITSSGTGASENDTPISTDDPAQFTITEFSGGADAHKSVGTLDGGGSRPPTSMHL